MFSVEEAWALLKACPSYFYDPEDRTEHMIIMSDVWSWASADGFVLTDENVCRVAELYDRYGSSGFLYYQIESQGYKFSEFEDNNRAIQFVTNEERILAEVPDSNKRAYFKAEYHVDGQIK